MGGLVVPVLGRLGLGPRRQPGDRREEDAGRHRKAANCQAQGQPAAGGVNALGRA